MNKEGVVYTYIYILYDNIYYMEYNVIIKCENICIIWNINHKKNEITPLAAAWMDLEIIILSELE